MRRRSRLRGPQQPAPHLHERCSAETASHPVCAVFCGFGRGSIPFSSVAAMKNTARPFHCALCHLQVVLCRRCDHGNIYCSRCCGEKARRQSQRGAGRRYQNSRRGRHKHAQRQRRYRERRLCRPPEKQGGGQKVTHHPLTRGRLRPDVSETQTERRGTKPFGSERPARVFRCHSCGRFCAQAVYPGLRPVRHPARRG